MHCLPTVTAGDGRRPRMRWVVRNQPKVLAAAPELLLVRPDVVRKCTLSKCTRWVKHFRNSEMPHCCTCYVLKALAHAAVCCCIAHKFRTVLYIGDVATLHVSVDVVPDCCVRGRAGMCGLCVALESETLAAASLLLQRRQCFARPRIMKVVPSGRNAGVFCVRP